MKKILMIVAFLATTLNMMAAGTKPSGSGTQADPYLIENADHLAWFSYDGVALTNNFVAYAKLMQDVTIPSSYRFTLYNGDVVHFDLNGHNLSGEFVDPVFYLDQGAVLNLYDLENNSGKITTGERAVTIYGGATFNMYGGTITGFSDDGNAGPAVAVFNGTFNMKGGVITGNEVKSSMDSFGYTRDYRGVVYVNAYNGYFNMTGGSITGNKGVTKGAGVYCVNDIDPNQGNIAYDNGCLAAGTLVTMADGSKRAIETVSIGDRVMTINHETGEVTDEPVFFIHQTKTAGAFTMHFSNGTDVDVVKEHCFFEKNSNRYVTVDTQSVYEYIGSDFYCAETKEWVALTSVTPIEGAVDTYALVVAHTINHYANGMLATILPNFPVYNAFEFGNNLMFDQEKKAADIAMYGLMDYETVKDIVTPGFFDAINGQYANVLIGKGMTDMDKILGMVAAYLPKANAKSNVRLLAAAPTAHVTLSGKVIISGNTLEDGTTPSNLAVGEGLLKIENLEAGSDIGIDLCLSIEDPDNSDARLTTSIDGILAANVTEGDAQYFTADKEGAVVVYADGSLKLIAGVSITAHEDPEHAGVYYSTYHNATQAYKVPAGVKAYKAVANAENTALNLIEIEGGVIGSGTAVILKSSTDSYNLTSSATDPDTNSGNELFGYAEETAYPSGVSIYALSAFDGKVGFYLIDKSMVETLPINKAYFSMPISNNAKRGFTFSFAGDENATGIINVSAKKADNAIYNLAGQRINEMQKGINIVNGKKVIKK